MTRLIAFGEALVDMLSSRLGTSSAQETFTPYAGGAPANVAVACARLGVPSLFVGMLGRDRFGDFILDELSAHGVDVSHVARTSEAKTALAFVSRDTSGERRFDFYRPPSADLLYRPEHLPEGLFDARSILHLCSNTLTEEAITATTFAVADRAAAAGALVSVDANLRPNLWPEHRVDAARVTALLDRAQLIKLAKEELELLRGDTSEEAYLQARLAAGAALIVITDGGEPVTAVTAHARVKVAPPKVRVVDTTAAGDAFIGGLLARLVDARLSRSTLADWTTDEARMRESLEFATRCGAFTVTRPGSYAALPKREDLASLLA
ncbi:carbohydrate kinase family protein [Archangium primigenium]|uniref:carbohydrate kinase family protein n=1 Tax=[Archangium] primigenium TaxID=2792470 RepID=UPI0019573313|nr:carbohydrate kinase [Archangium primigenium]MBM7117480.1 carbohydrate kinase [Archangium primigenium]